MAVKLPTARTTFLRAVRDFPRWMSIRKRPDKAISGLHLQSIVDEQTDIMEELNRFIKEFFLITYVGKESNIAAYVYIIQVGDIDVAETNVIHPALDLTVDGKYWLQHINSYALYQEGYIIISVNNLPEDQKLLYSYNGYQYGGKLERYHIWNIFDEFAMFLGLERFVDVQETNAQLLRRCFLVFQNPTNSTRTGLQNVILNSVSNDVTLDRDSISIEIPDENNMWLPNEQYGTVYEYLAQLNKDVFRTKRWNIDQWEHNFKKLGYLPHQWDKALEVYQDGTGQMGDLKVTLAQDEEDTTSVTVRGFKKDVAKINEYFHKQDIHKTIDISLQKYTNLLNAQKVQYQIIATPTIKIDPTSIYLREQTKSTGVYTFNLQDIVTNTNGAEIVNNGLLQKDKTYELLFKPRDNYTDMAIRKLNLVSDSGTNSLLEEQRSMVFDSDGVLKYKESLKHITKLSQLKSYTNMIETQQGLTIGRNSLEGMMTVDVTGCNGKVLKVLAESEMFDVTQQYSLWSLDGLKLGSDLTLYSDSQIAREESAVLELDCMGFSFELEQAINQGTVLVKIWEDGTLNYSNTISTPNQPLTRTYDVLTHVKVQFIKSGEYPFKVKNIKATKYEISYSLSTGQVIQGKNVLQLSDIPAGKSCTLTIRVKSYDVVMPTIKYIHVGSSAARATYKVSNITATADTDYLDIDTDCTVELYEIEGNSKVLIDSDYKTNWAYYNPSADDVKYLEVNVNNFSQINSSSRRISKTTRNGNVVSYITLAPAETLNELTISGTLYQDKSRRTIKDILGLEDRYNVYIAKRAEGFIIRDTTNNEEWFARIERSQLSDADTFIYENLPGNAIGFFNVNRAEQVVTVANSTDRAFEDTYISIQTTEDYIAYNEVNMYKPILGDLENVKIANTFSPILDMNQLMLYIISEVKNTTNDRVETVVSFKKKRYSKDNYYGLPHGARARIQEIMLSLSQDTAVQGQVNQSVTQGLSELKQKYGIDIQASTNLYNALNEILTQGYWSLGQRELYLSTNINFGGTENYGQNVHTVSPTFSISSTIDLERNMTMPDGSVVDIAEYVITPPKDMEVVYDDMLGDIIENGLIVNEDGFNKLQYSNIANIVSLYVNNSPYTNYTLLPTEGIIVWNDVNELLTRLGADNELTGEFFSVAYEYNIPNGLKYKDISSMYDMISYTTDAYVPVSVISVIPEQLNDGDIFPVEFQSEVDFVPQPECSNSNFIANYNNGQITIQRLYTDNSVIVQTGYYYDNNKEYYYYNHDHYNSLNSLSNVVLHNVKKLELTYQLMIATTNYLLNTDFIAGDDYAKLCYVDFVDKRIETTGISKLNIITACDTYNMWQSFNMVISFVEGINGLGILFSPDDENAYAILNLTKYLYPGALVSMFATNDIKLSIYRENFINTFSLDKSVFASPFATFEHVDNFYGWQVSQDIDLNYKYYLVVQGNGIIDDLIVKDNVSIDNNFFLHVKNLDTIGFNVLEQESSGTLLNLQFDPEGCNLDCLEINKDNTIQMGSNVDYGLTKIWEMQDDYDQCLSDENVIRRKNMFLTTDKHGTITTPLIYVENSKSVYTLFVKINNLMHDNTQFFNVTGYSTQSLDAPMVDLGVIKKVNVASFMSNQVNSYMQFKIEAERNRIIDSIEVFAQYAEMSNVLRVEDYTHGSIITKMYDVGTEGNYKLKCLEGTFNNLPYCTLYMRGYKQNQVGGVWTEWYQIKLDYNLNASQYAHVFNNYRFFQFKLDLNHLMARANIKNFVLEVV